jgi:hypothetical protein
MAPFHEGIMPASIAHCKHRSICCASIALTKDLADDSVAPAHAEVATEAQNPKPKTKNYTPKSTTLARIMGILFVI